jgi:uncharacterized membrane protein YjgN (DUF898 family)
MKNGKLVVKIINPINWSLSQMKRPYKSKLKSWAYSYASSWIDLAQGIIGVLTFGFVTPGWDMQLMLWASKNIIIRRINANNDKPRNGKAGRTK